ncbi:hypothetical protein BS50DRAFT_570330 [Corynespora cassiicola Philippines]|uniref:Zn(2)-C6 fungal-type domain-containing protein n=1 Tax=Corynespora cassiicola Philippines TaxID=1448308 RepID=A0A2T2NZQ2_CORCC|nr:hypothetical protein BS50DRAFT_570330 [Corynespora cassiicola Philippines]
MEGDRRVADGGAESPGLVAQWLDNLDFCGEAQGVINGESTKEVAPTTPARKPAVRSPATRVDSATYHDISPTNTTFSSIFDPGSPCPGDARLDYDTDASSVDEDDWASCYDEKEAAAQQLEHVAEVNGDDEVASLVSYDPPSDDELSPEELAQAQIQDAQPATQRPTRFDKSKPNGFLLTSCLQCVVKGLPCSRKPPYCTRCKRSGYADMCLLHRRLCVGEPLPKGQQLSGVPVLLMLAEEDPEVRARKRKLRDEMEEQWREARDRRNWVLPVNDEKKGDFKSMGFRQWEAWPGVGEGRNMLFTGLLAEEEEQEQEQEQEEY